MFKKKDIDLASIIQERYSELNNSLLKDTEILEEQQYDATETVRKMPEISVKPRMWSRGGTVEATELEDIVKALKPTGTDGLSRYKSCITNLTKVLGTATGVSGLPVEEQEQTTNINEIFSAVQLKGVMGNIIFNQSPQTAGKIFEALVARMIGGSIPEEESGSIEDFKDASGNFISLKVVDRTTEVKGSKFNLAKGITEAPNKKISYLILLKDKRRNPFSFKTYSYSLTMNNYFQFLSGGEHLTLQKVQNMIKDIAVSAKGLNEAQEKESNIDAYYDTFKKYAQEILGVTSDDPKEIALAVSNKFSEIMQRSSPDKGNFNQQQFYEQFLKNFEPLVIPKSTGKQPINVNMFISLVNDLNNIKNLDDNTKKQIFGPETYAKDFADVLRKLTPLTQFVNQIDTIYHRTRNRSINDRAMNMAQEKVASMLTKSSSTEYESEKLAVDAEIKKFFTLVSAGEYTRKEGEKDTQFKIPLAYALQFAKQTSSDYDDSYPEVIIDGSILFTSAQKSAELLKQYVEPIYEHFNDLDLNLKKYFVKNQPSGIKEAQGSTEKLKQALQEHPGSKGKAASEIETSALQENKTVKPLTKHWSDDILDWVQNLK